MGVNPEIAGKVYPPATFEVGREKIREFAEAINSTDPVHTDPEAARAKGHPDVIAPPTLAVLISQRGDGYVFVDPEAGIDFSRVVHGEQRFVHHRPIVAGDVLTSTTTVDKVGAMGKHSQVLTRGEVVDAKGEAVCTAYSTIVIRGE
jgi:acyl dehydratase